MSWRFILGLPLAAIIAFGLFLAMSKLIEPDEVEIVEPEPRERIIIGRQLDDTIEDDVDPPKPTEIDPPEPPDTDTEITIEPPDIKGGIPTPPTEGDPEILPPVLDRDPQPIVRVNPEGWETCLSGREGEEHFVRLVFDVSPAGDVTNIEAAESSVPCLERSAIRAAQRWRYAPKIENGEPVWQYGVSTTIRYRLEG
ncbi:MAG: TonB family protein [Pseudomonadota bacterium]